MKYERKIQKLESNSKYLESMLEEYREIEHYFETELLEKDKEKAFRDIIELIRKISDYILQDSEKTKTEVDHIMGGKVLKLQTDIELERIEQAEKRAGERAEMNKQRQLNSLNHQLILAGRIDDLSRSCTDLAFQNELLKEYGL